ncbi:hypothetical protein SAY87_017103 [Trapa incisa]|uniref:Fe2OG dioxygenase domain-containing protein n=1 Tax=Trapa incisa TaxID=236973 RepID=A0AAN7LJ21_9MYRT|nr:hypothetical protein SAY87_017103 [Trapa incisa]
MSSLLDKTTDLLLHLPPAMDRRSSGPSSNGSGIPDFSSLQNQVTLPLEFTWPKNDLAETEQRPHELKEPVVDLKGFMDGDKVATARAVELVRVACSTHGFFQVTNHGIDRNLIGAAYDAVESVFRLPWNKKMSIKRKVGSFCGFSGGHVDRYSSKLPWKETFSFGYSYSRPRSVIDYFHSVLGPDFEHAGVVYEKYCEAVKELSHVIMELLALSLGVDRMHYRKFFEDGSSIMRCNYYPPCSQSSLTLGTGPHTDPTSITILHQDQVGGLQVFSGGSWLNIRPRPDSFVINIGDTFAVISIKRFLYTKIYIGAGGFVLIARIVCLTGSVKREMQELLASGGREQVAGEEVAGVLRLPSRGQGGEASTGAGRKSGPKVPRLQVVRPVGFHSESL